MTSTRVLVALLLFKLAMVGLSFASARLGPLPGVPETTDAVRLLAVFFIGSSLALLEWRRWLGVLSTICFGALSFYGALTSLVVGLDVVWSAVALVSSFALIAVALPLRRAGRPAGTRRGPTVPTG